ncbi:MAG TPA: beta-ketoacyl-[acyl-carrier-protein] synthase family protein [Cyclobacteriaceae bacterium]|nr:beta-ketoacyl-[acyl-carrier-protein] synthase family protein [Cyclobacteriaceae bacterium]
MNANVHVAGAGLISAIGNSVLESLHALQNDRSGIGPLTLFESIHGHLPVGEVKLSNRALAEKLNLSLTYPRAALLGIHAAREAVRDSGIPFLAKWRTGLISATTVGGMDNTENFFPHFLKNTSSGRLRDVIHHSCGSSTELIADDLGINGFISTVNTACSSSVNSIIFATRLIREGILDVAVAGGTDALTRFTLNGFNSLMILDKQPCRPFDAHRNGLNLGEGAGFLVLVSGKVVREEKIKSTSRVAGHGNANDAFHQTASSPEGRGSYSAMMGALKVGGLKTADIGYINMHGTGTLNNDLSEATAIKRLFGDDTPKLSSTKGFTGHTLGASGGIEAVFSSLALTERCVFSNPGFVTPMPEVNIIPQRHYSAENLAHVMSNSFGFGGNCSAIIFSKN